MNLAGRPKEVEQGMELLSTGASPPSQLPASPKAIVPPVHTNLFCPAAPITKTSSKHSKR